MKAPVQALIRAARVIAEYARNLRSLDEDVVAAAVTLSELHAEELDKLAEHLAAAYGALRACGHNERCKSFAELESTRARAILDHDIDMEIYDERYAIIYKPHERPRELIRAADELARAGFRLVAYDEEYAAAECCGARIEVFMDYAEHPDCHETPDTPLPPWCKVYKVKSKTLCNGICKEEFRSLTEALIWAARRLLQLKQKMKTKG